MSTQIPDPANAADFFIAADSEHISRERAKARDMRQSQWWKNELGKGRCHYCGGRFHPKELTMDHIVPVVRGGSSSKSNVVPCCKACNNAKRYHIPGEQVQLPPPLAGGADDTPGVAATATEKAEPTYAPHASPATGSSG